MNDTPKPTPMELAQAKLAQMKADGIKVEVLNAIEKSKRNPLSRPLAMKGRCWQCEGIEDPNTADRIAACSVTRCGLHALRPHQPGGHRAIVEKLVAAAPAYPPGTILGPLERARSNPASRSAAIRAYCWDCMGGKANGKSGANGNVRKLVNECSVEDCCIWHVRPWQKTGETDETGDEPETDTDPGDED